MRKLLFAFAILTTAFAAMTESTWSHGKHTCGLGGEAALLGYGLDSLVSLTGDDTLNYIGSPYSEVSAHGFTGNLNGYRLVIMSSSPPLGVAKNGKKISFASPSLVYTIAPIGTGTVEIKDQNWLFLNGAISPPNNIGAAGQSVKYLIHDNIFNGMNNFTELYSGSWAAFPQLSNYIIANNIIINFNDGCGIMLLNDQYANDTIINNTIVGCRVGVGVNVTSGNASSILFQNNIIANSSYACVYWGGSAQGTGNYNATTDGTGNGWAAGKIGNQLNITTGNELNSIDTNSDSFCKVFSSGVCETGGTTPAISTILYPFILSGIRGTSRPHGASYSIGADEYLNMGSIIVYDLPESWVYQRANDSAIILITGMYIDGVDTLSSVQCQFLKYGTSTVLQDWTTFASTLSGIYSGSIKLKWQKVPMTLRVRGMHGSTPVDTATGTTKFSIGDVYLVWGQSNATILKTDTTLGHTMVTAPIFTYNNGVSVAYSDSGWWGRGNSVWSSWGNTLYTLDSVPKMIINRALSSTALINHVGLGCWGIRDHPFIGDTLTLYDKLLYQATQYLTGAIPAGIMGYQGENDALEEVQQDHYRDTLALLASWFRSDLGNNYIPFYYVQLGRFGSPNQFAINRVRWAQSAANNSNACDYIAATAIPWAECADSTHLNRYGQDSLGPRIAWFVYNKKRGPYITGLKYGVDSCSFVVSIANNGTTLLPTSGLTAFLGRRANTPNGFDFPDSERTINATTRKVYFNVPQDSLFYAYGNSGYITVPLYDNQTLRLPLEAYGGSVSGGGAPHRGSWGFGFGAWLGRVFR